MYVAIGILVLAAAGIVYLTLKSKNDPVPTGTVKEPPNKVP